MVEQKKTVAYQLGILGRLDGSKIGDLYITTPFRSNTKLHHYTTILL